MRAAKRKRPHGRAFITPPEGVDLQEIARIVRYVGSPEHKTFPSFAGQPRPRADATICDPSLSQDPGTLTRHLRRAVLAGQTGAPWEGNFPRYIWCRIENEIYEARLINRETGQYKGYRLERGECPAELSDRHE